MRFDSAIYSGYRIPPYYDSLAGKLIVHAKNRNECLLRLRRALDELVVGGIETTIPCSRSWCASPTSSMAIIRSIGWKNIWPVLGH